MSAVWIAYLQLVEPPPPQVTAGVTSAKTWVWVVADCAPKAAAAPSAEPKSASVRTTASTIFFTVCTVITSFAKWDPTPSSILY